MSEIDRLHDQTYRTRDPFDAKPLDAEEYRNLLEQNEELVLRVSDGTADGTFRFWIGHGGKLYWRCLNWHDKQQATMTDLSATLDEDSTTQLLIERPQEGSI